MSSNPTDRSSVRAARSREFPLKRNPHDAFGHRNGTADGRSPENTLVRRLDNEMWHVSDEWPELAPVSPKEIDVLETFFGDLLDELLGDPHARK
jgi:hypothetical protein